MKKLLLKRTWWNKKDLFLKIKEKLEKIPKNHKILDGLWEVLDDKQKSFVKNNLISDLIWILEMKINF